jgi:acetyl-CoA C-acetyltransferase
MKSYVIGAAKTPRGKGKVGKGALTDVHPQELLATVLRALPAQAGFDVKDVTMTSSEQSENRSTR